MSIKKRIKHLSKWGLVYWSPLFYRMTMALLRGGRGRDAMYQYVAEEIGKRSVLELCCGTGELIPWVHGRYYGIDCNPAFAKSLRRQGMQVSDGDVLLEAWQETECLVMVDSLYHFIDRIDVLLKRIQQHPAETIIISEPVDNLFPRLKGWKKNLAAWMTRVEGQYHPHRYSEEDLRAFFKKQGFQKVHRVGTNLIGVKTK